MNEAKPITLWQAIDRLTQQIPFTRQSVETALSTTLLLQESKLRRDSYRSQPIQLVDGVVIENVDLRVSQTGASPGFLFLPVGGACIPLAQISEHYTHVYFSMPTYTQSPDERKYYSTDLPWGKLHFGFRQGDPRCLASVSIDPSDTGRVTNAP